MEWLEGLYDLLFPVACTGCGVRLPGAHLPLCGFCAAVIEKAEREEVQAQLAQLTPDRSHLGVPFAMWMYDEAGVVRRLHHALKYQNRPRYGLELGAWMARSLQLAWEECPPDILVPLPLHYARYLERGYNQSLMLARGIHAVTGVPLDASTLVRRRHTRSQTGLDRKERWNNVRDAFYCPDGSFHGRHVLLIDDVITTGATLLAAAHSLIEAGGARSVRPAALAFTRP